MSKKTQFTRRQVMKGAAAAGAVAVAGKATAQVCADTVPVDIATVAVTGCAIDFDVYPPSPFIMNPFVDLLPVPTALAPGYRNPDGTLAATQAWNVRQSNGVFGNFTSAPGPGVGQQDSIGDRPMHNDGKTYTFVNPTNGATTTKTLNFGGARGGTHQLYPGGQGVSYALLAGQAKTAFDLLNANPILYHIRTQVRTHTITKSPVVAFNAQRVVTTAPAAAAPTAAGTVRLPTPAAGTTWGVAAGTVAPQYLLPASTIYGFNGTFPGPMINFEYGRPAIVRFENDLDLNPLCRNRGDFGAPDWAQLTHLHNGHTAPESDGNPNHMQENEGGYQPGQWVDNLYLGYGAGGLDAEKQSFLWFHDHRMHHTGPNVYKGMVGLMPHYDPATAFNPGGIDSGDETTGLRLPGVRTNNPDGSFNVAFDIPLALYDCRMDDGIAQHRDSHQPLTPQPYSNNVCGNTHPEWWGQLFLQHYPNHGFVGDIFTVNCVAFPTINVERRHYRFRFLGASLARQYRLKLSNTFGGFKLAPFPGYQGQWGFVDNKNRPAVPPQCMKMTQIASEGGLLNFPLLVDYIDIWPAKRREVVVDFAAYMNGTATKAGEVIYLTNHFGMVNGRVVTNVDKMESDAGGGAVTTVVPLVKFVIASNQLPIDNSDPGLSPHAIKNQVKAGHMFNPAKVLRPRLTPPVPFNDPTAQTIMDFTLQRGGTFGGETEWLINSLQFDPLNPLWAPTVNTFEHWGIDNGGGGWTHPMHIHFEEHQVTYRSTGPIPFLQPDNTKFAQPNHLEDGPLTQVNLGTALAPILCTAGLGKEDVVNLEGSERTKIYRGFRTFLGNYVAHCHNLAHEDHNMMFGWSITL